MASKNDSLAGNFESTAQRMLDALDKASTELSKTVDACVDQLSQYNTRLQKSLSDRLQQLKDQFLSNAAGTLAELESHKEGLIEGLEEFERTQIDTIATTARTVRESLNAYAQQVEEKMSKLVEEQLAALQSALQAPEEEIPGIAQEASAKFRGIAGGGKERIDETEIKNEETLAGRAQDFENQLQELVSRWKDDIYSQVAKLQDEFKSKVDSTINTLTELSQQNIDELKTRYDEGSESVGKAVSAGRKEAETIVRAWREEVSDNHESFISSLGRQRQDFEKTNSSKLEYKANEAKGEINGLSKEAREKIQASHKVLQNSLTRLEQDYRRRLEAIFSSFETTISETARRASSSSSMQRRAADELQEKLQANLSSQGSDILRIVKKLSEQLEMEYVRASRNLDDRIETIRSASVESLEKQVQTLKMELDKIARSFQHDLGDLMNSADELEEAGKSAAVTVMAYRSALLSLDSD